MITLSYSSLKNLHEASHSWLNKQMGIPVPNYPFLKAGRKAHRLIQDHVSGKLSDKNLSHIKERFPIVEEKDFDERCKFDLSLKGLYAFTGEDYPFKQDYRIIGFFDGLDPENKRFLEIKTSYKPWSLNKFQNAVQRKIYSLARPEFEEAYLITGRKDPELWEEEAPKVYSVPLTSEDVEDAIDWISEGVEILEAGEFDGGLDEGGYCTGCFWNLDRYEHLANCNFRRDK